MPEGIVTLRISRETGTLVSAENPDGISETVHGDHLPGGAGQYPGSEAQQPAGGRRRSSESEPIF